MVSPSLTMAESSVNALSIVRRISALAIVQRKRQEWFVLERMNKLAQLLLQVWHKYVKENSDPPSLVSSTASSSDCSIAIMNVDDIGKDEDAEPLLHLFHRLM